MRAHQVSGVTLVLAICLLGIGGCVSPGGVRAIDDDPKVRSLDPIARVEDFPGADVAISGDGQAVVTLQGRKVVFESLKDHSRIHRAWTGQSDPGFLRTDANGIVWITCLESSELSRVDFDSLTMSPPRRFGRRQILGLASADTGDTIVVADSAGTVTAYDWTSAEPKWTRALKSGLICTVSISADAKSIAYECDHSIVVEDTRDGDGRVAWDRDGRSLQAIAVSSDGTRVVTFHRGGILADAILHSREGVLALYHRGGEVVKRSFPVIANRGTSEWIESVGFVDGPNPLIVGISDQALRMMRPTDLGTVGRYVPKAGLGLRGQTAGTVRQHYLAVRSGTTVLVFRVGQEPQGGA